MTDTSDDRGLPMAQAQQTWSKARKLTPMR